jgi:hypothetical protein
MQFSDGYKICALHGVRVAPEFVENPKEVTAKMIEKELNAEVRRLLIDRYGVARYLLDTGAGIVDKTETATLYRKQQPGDEPIAIVQVQNSTPEPDGSYKQYFLRVPPYIRTAREAVAWTFGMSAEQYNPEAET